jgi:hypothetical protein
MTKWFTLLSLIWEVPGSNINPETCYPDRFYVVFSVPAGKYRHNTLGHDCFLPHPSQFIRQSSIHSTLYNLTY